MGRSRCASLRSAPLPLPPVGSAAAPLRNLRRVSLRSVRALYVSGMAATRKPARTAAAQPKPPTEAEAAAARQRARERAGEDEHPRKSGPARGGKG